MTKEFIEFKKERDLGSIITDAFKFIRLEGKPFLITILKTAIIPIVIAVVAMMYYMISMSSLSTDGVNGGIGVFISSILLLVAYLLAFVFINLAGMHYIQSYIDNNGVVNQEEIKQNTKDRFWSFTGFGFLSGIIMFISVLLCVFPMFYTWTVLSLGASVLVFENQSATSTIGRCFDFIKGHFWETLGVVFVVSLLVGVLGYIFQIPATIYQIIKMGIGLNSQDPTEVFSLFSDPIYLILNVVSIVGQLMFYSITLITNVFLYFDINEQKNLTGTIEKIDGLGK